MDFSLSNSIELLERTPAVLSLWLSHVPDDWIRRTDESETWSAYNVIGHLIHGEKTDWIPRTEIILGNGSDRRFPEFDREAQFKLPSTRTIVELLHEFSDLSNSNLHILRTKNITDTELEMTGIHPEFGVVTLRQLLSTWVVHDLAHISQIARVMAKHYKIEVGPWNAYLGILNKEGK